MTTSYFDGLLDWPTLEEVKQRLDVGDTDDWDGTETSGEGVTRISRLLEAAIAHVKQDCGIWDEDADYPDAELAEAAMRMVELMAPPKNQTIEMASKDRIYQLLMFGKHRTFGIA